MEMYKIKRFLKFIREPSNEFGFLVLSIHKHFSNLPAYVCIDDHGSWINLCDKKIVLFQTNTKSKPDFNKMLPMSIENEPKILVKNEKIDLNKSEIYQIKHFVIECQEQLLQINIGEIDVIDFFEALRKKGFYKEKKEYIRAFSNSQKREAYEKQKGIRKKCNEHFELQEMEADHIRPWHEGRKTSADNCQMICRARKPY